jgi:ATP-binding cassette, subfamily B, bacterial PglK
MIEFTTKLSYITRGSHRALVATLFLFIFISCLEVFSTGIVGPFVAIAIDPALVRNNYWLNLIYQQLNFGSELNFLVVMGTIIVVSFFAKALLSFNAQKLVFKFSNGIKASLSYKLLQAYIEAPYIYHLRINSANLIQNITHTTDTVSIGLISTLLTFISNSVIVLALMLLLIKTNAIALAFIAVLLLVSFGLIYPLKNRLSRWSKAGYQAYGEMIRIVNHGLGGLKETRIIGCESYFEHQMQEQAEIFANSSYLASAYGNLPRFVLEPLMISFLIGFTFLFMMLNQGNLQNLAGVLSIFALASVRLLPAIGNMIYGMNVIRSNAYCLDKLFFELKELAAEKIVVESDFTSAVTRSLPSANREIFSFSRKITIGKLGFHYPGNNKQVLEDISLTIEKGESIGIIGKSGSGKTTLADILLGRTIYSPNWRYQS